MSLPMQGTRTLQGVSNELPHATYRLPMVPIGAQLYMILTALTKVHDNAHSVKDTVTHMLFDSWILRLDRPRWT